MSEPRRGPRRRGRRQPADRPHGRPNGRPPNPTSTPAPPRARDGDRAVPELRELGPFAIFCALHLGITDRDGYAPRGARAIARSFDLSDEELDDYLRSNGLRECDLLETGFDLESARLDIAVAPPGISRVELARTLFAEVGDPGDRRAS